MPCLGVGVQAGGGSRGNAVLASKTYHIRAEEAAEEARGTTLVNVRERALRAEATWREMADRARLVEENKREREEASGLAARSPSV